MPYGSLSHYWSEEDGDESCWALMLRFDKKGVAKVFAESSSESAMWVQMVMIYMDIVMLRYLESYAAIGQDFRDDFSFYKDLSSHDLIDSETLICDKRAKNRYPDGVSVQSRTIWGTRFVATWKIQLKGFKSAALLKTEVHVPVLVIPSDYGLCMLLPQQKAIMPLYWREVPSFGSKKKVFSIRHQAPALKAVVYVFEFSDVGAATALKDAVQMVLGSQEQRSLSPFPKLYPPMKNFSANHLKVPLTAEETAEVETKTKSLAESRLRILKQQAVKPQAKQPNFTMRFMKSAVMQEMDEDDSDEDNEDLLAMIDNEEV